MSGYLIYIYKVFVLASFNSISEKEYYELYDVLKLYINSEDFVVVLINQSKKKNRIRHKNLYVIDLSTFRFAWKRVNKRGNWVSEIKKHETWYAQLVYYTITKKMIFLLKSKLNIV